MNAPETPRVMSRWRAALIHLLISFVIVGGVAAWIILFWYPPAILRMVQADQMLMLLGGVDLIVGPMLTLLVYKHGKPTLRMDLTVIGVLQALFLAVGLYSVTVTRPVFLVAYDQDLHLVAASEISDEHFRAAAGTPYDSAGFTRPRLVGVKMPAGEEDRTRIIMSALTGGGDLQTMPRYYTEYSAAVPELLKGSRPLSAGPGVSEERARLLQAAAADYGRKPEELRFVKLLSVRGNGLMLVDAKSGEPVGAVNIRE